MSYERGFDHVLDTVRNTKRRGRAVSLLIGAGCSVTAGIPLASGFVEQVEKRYPAKCRDVPQPHSYSACMAALSRPERRDLVAEYVDKARINWPHLCIALLIQHGYVDRVLTTNFDPLVVRACALLNQFPAVYDFAASQEFRAADIPGQAVFYLHGQRGGFVQLHTAEECQDHAKRMQPVFADASNGRVWIVVGYSGDNDPVFTRLADVPYFDDGLYWVGHLDRAPAPHVREHLLEQNKDAYFLPGHDADGFFVELTRRLGLFPPDLLNKPFTHLAACLDQLNPMFTELGQDTAQDVCRGPRDLVARAIRRFEEQVVEEPDRDRREVAEARSVSEFERLMMVGDYETLIAEYEKAPEGLSDDACDHVVWAYVRVGNLLSSQACAAQGPEAEVLFGRAGTRYAAALAIKPDFHEALYNWATTLSRHAQRTEGPEADRLFEQAGEKYAAALAAKPDLHRALNNWGTALHAQAETKQGEEADRLFREAGQKYAAALTIAPDRHETLYNWGAALFDQAERKHGEEADRLLQQAEQKYAAVLSIRPDYHWAYRDWGNVLRAQAPTKQGETAERLLSQAEDRYARALAIKPDEHATLNDYASTLLTHGRLPHIGHRGAAFFALAKGKALAAEQIKPGAGAYNAACACARLGEVDECRHWLEQARDLGVLPSRQHLLDDLDLATVRDTDWFQQLLAAAPE